MTWLLDVIHDRPHTTRDRGAYTCPINQAECGSRCFIRHACITQPRELTALLDRIDQQTAIAISRHLHEEQT